MLKNLLEAGEYAPFRSGLFRPLRSPALHRGKGTPVCSRVSSETEVMQVLLVRSALGDGVYTKERRYKKYKLFLLFLKKRGIYGTWRTGGADAKAAASVFSMRELLLLEEACLEQLTRKKVALRRGMASGRRDRCFW